MLSMSQKRGRTDGHLSKDQYNAGAGGASSSIEVTLCILRLLEHSAAAKTRAGRAPTATQRHGSNSAAVSALFLTRRMCQFRAGRLL